MNVRIQLDDAEIRQWEDTAGGGRDALLANVRRLTEDAHVERVEVFAGGLQLVELAPSQEKWLAKRLKECALTSLVELLDPAKTPDEVQRARYVKDLARIGELYSQRDVTPVAEEPVRSAPRQKRRAP